MNFSHALKELNKGERLHIGRGTEAGFSGYIKIVDNAIHYFGIDGKISLAVFNRNRIDSQDWEIYTDESEVFDVAAGIKFEAETIEALNQHKAKLISVLQKTDQKLIESKERALKYKEYLTNLTQLQRD